MCSCTFSVSFECPSGWIYWSGNCYKQNQDLLTWGDAEKKCIEYGGHLASVHSDQENNFIFQTSKKAVTWLGGNDLEAEGSWIWSDGSSWSYSNWQSGQPDNARGGVLSPNFIQVFGPQNKTEMS